MSGLDRWFIAAVHALPRKSLSRSVRRAAQRRSRMAVRRFAAMYDVDLSEAEKPLEAYGSVLALFTRRLKPGARPVDVRPEVVVSPVDGRWASGGAIGDGCLVQAKGRTYTLDALLAASGAGDRWAAGSFACLYLAPGDYHRVHSPVDGTIEGYTHVPGDLFPVNSASVRWVDGLYARNERVITHVRGKDGARMAVVKVGATNVGRIQLAYAPALTTNRPNAEMAQVAFDVPIPIRRGDELASFELGSTVILVTERPVDWDLSVSGEAVRMGRPLGRWRAF